ncbi:hypothetical protein HII31_06335 [Pseudocercospora fuligena]|uniref:SnoaL-like domain-containing protein n=1 Tax=Pseudocercospora fuligena TaxID=685502 RepID=A0A8H6RJJ4_9PEZI|nr:hypothetical protein HII31_06335 [Pseudocercospora fuligena]
MSYPLTIPKIDPTTKDAIIDTLYRACLSYDLNDVSLHDSAFVDSSETSFDMSGIATYKGLDEIRKIHSNVGPLDTTHLVTNPRIVEYDEVKGTARLTASTVAQHFRKGEGNKGDAEKLMTGSLYDMDLVREGEGVWKVMHFRMKVVWREGDQSVVFGS